MSYWTPTYTGRWTPEELDALALRGDPIDKMGFHYKCRPEPDALESEHYAVRTINTQGMGNHGDVVLVGKTPHGRRMVRRGKIARLVREGCPEEIAEIAITVTRGMEEPVWRMAIDLLPMAEHGMSLAFRGHRHFSEETGIRDHGLSFPRIEAAAEIARRAAHRRAVA